MTSSIGPYEPRSSPVVSAKMGENKYQRRDLAVSERKSSIVRTGTFATQVRFSFNTCISFFVIMILLK